VKPRIEIYGPSGIRNFVRQIMKMTLTRTAECYMVHELVTPKDRITPCLLHDDTVNSLHQPDVMHCNEVVGQDILCSEDGFWRQITRSRGVFGEIFVDVGPIAHRGQPNPFMAVFFCHHVRDDGPQTLV
jgi:ribonuclease Z